MKQMLSNGFMGMLLSMIQLNAQEIPVDKWNTILQNHKSRIGNVYSDTSKWKISSLQKLPSTNMYNLHLQRYYQGFAVFNNMVSLVADDVKILSDFGSAEKNNELSFEHTDTLNHDELWGSFRRHYRLPEAKISKFQIVEADDWLISKWSNEPLRVIWEWYPVFDGNYRKCMLITWLPLDGRGWLMTVIDAGTGDWVDEISLSDDTEIGVHIENARDSVRPMQLLEKQKYPNGHKNISTLHSATFHHFPLPMEGPHQGDAVNTLRIFDDSIQRDWFYDGATLHDSTRGNFVWVQEDRDVNNATMGRAAGTQNPLPDISFGIRPDFSQTPSLESNLQSGMVNLFYTINKIHDLMVLYGFDEQSGNFQQYQYTPYGAGNDLVIADAQDAGGINNANFSTPPDGLKPRMQLYLFNRTVPARDAGFDNTLIVHEYMHGISNRLTGGPATTTCLRNAEQASEGWSDYLALMLTTDWSTIHITDSTRPRVMGAYVTGNTAKGIRTYPYSTSLAVNPLTYARLPQTNGNVHKMGEIWCSVLWDMTWKLMEMEGINPQLENTAAGGGNVMALQLVIQAMKIQPCQPGFLDARDAILKMDTLLYGGVHACAIWKAFARRGMGVFAVQGSSGDYRDQVADYHVNPLYLHMLAWNPIQARAGEQLTLTHHFTFSNCSIVDRYQLYDTLPQNVSWLWGGTYDSVYRIVKHDIDLADGQADSVVFSVQLDEDCFHSLDTLWRDTVSTASFHEYWRTESMGYPQWQINQTNAVNSGISFFCPNLSLLADEKLILKNNIFIPEGKTTLIFTSRMQSEFRWDGGVVEASSDNGSSWFDLGPNMKNTGYTDKLNIGVNPLSGRKAFTGQQHVADTIKVDLSDFDGDSLLLRFRFGSDASLGFYGWIVDDIMITHESQVRIKSALFDQSSIPLLTHLSEIPIQPPVPCQNPLIGRQPESVRVCALSDFSFRLYATGDSLNYQWQKSRDGEVYENIIGATDATLMMQAASMEWHENRFRCLIWGACGNLLCSDTVMLFVDSLPLLRRNVYEFARCEPGRIGFNLPIPERSQWYYSWLTEGDAIFSAIAPNDSITLKYETTYLTENQSYRAIISDSLTGCNSRDTLLIHARIYPTPLPPVVSGADRCGPGRVVLRATHMAFETIRWYSNQGDSLLVSGNTDSLILPFVNASVTYFAATLNPGCRSVRRTEVSVQIKPLPPDIARASNFSRCGTGVIALSATSAPGSVVCWYEDSLCTRLVNTAVSSGLSRWTTPELMSTSSYFIVNKRIDNSCISFSANKIKAIINEIPLPPMASQVSRCGEGRVQIIGKSPDSFSTIRWYSAASNIHPSAIGLQWITPVLSHDTSFFAETFNRQSRCSSLNRIMVPVRINPIPETPIAQHDSICGPGTAKLSIRHHNQYSSFWYTDALQRNLYCNNLDTISTPRISRLTSYFVLLKDTNTGCRSQLVRATVYIKSILPPPVSINYPPVACEWLGLDSSILLRCQSINGALGYEWKTDSDTILYSQSFDSFRLNLRQIAAGNRLSVRGTNGCPGLWKTITLCAPSVNSRSVVNELSDINNHSSWTFPNPFRDQLIVRLPEKNIDSAFVQVFDFSGRNYLAYKFNTDSDLLIQCADWPTGIYSIVLQYSGMSLIRKMIKLP